MYLIKKVDYSLEARGYRTQKGIKCFNIKGEDIVRECDNTHEVMFINSPVSKDEAYNKVGFRESENIGIIEYCNTYTIIKQFDLRTTLRLVVHKREKREVDGYLVFIDSTPTVNLKTNAKLLQRRDGNAIVLIKNKEGQYVKISDRMEEYMLKVIDGQLIQTA